jgi:uncharacterized membrane protein YgcG
MRPWGSALLLFGILAILGTALVQAAEDWWIERFETTIAIQKEGALMVEEAITVHFQAPRRGIFRDIPSNGLELEVLSVTDEARQPRPYQLEWASRGGRSYRRIRIGDPNIFVRGRHVYVMRYRVEGALSFLQDYDELYWNATGNEWPVPIESALSTVTLPEEIAGSDLKLRCFTGPLGSKAENCSIHVVDARTLRYEAQGLGVGEGLTIVVGFPKGLVAQPPQGPREPVQGPAEGRSPLAPYGKYMAIPLVTLLIVLVLWWVCGRDPWTKRSVMPQWNPPQDLSPAEVGVLFDERADLRDLSATIIHLAVRGYLKIRRLEERGGKVAGALSSLSTTIFGLVFAGVALLWMAGMASAGVWPFAAFGLPFLFGGLLSALGPWLRWWISGEAPFQFQLADYELIRLKEDDQELKPHERKLLEALFDGQTTRTLSELEHRFYKHLPELKQMLYKAVVGRGYFVGNPDTVRGLYYGIGGVLVMGGFAFMGLGFLSLGLWGDPFFGASLALAGLIVVGFAPLMPQKTPQGVKIAHEIVGLREYLSRAEKHRLEVLNAPEASPETFERLLPYAIALGVAERWAAQFEGLYTQPPSWYEGNWGPGPFGSRALASSLREFACNVERACTSVPSPSGSSSDFSSGGFSGGSSGGGRGGGGGGAW